MTATNDKHPRQAVMTTTLDLEKAVSGLGEVAIVPDRRWDSRYVHRKVGRVRDYDIFDWALQNATNVLIEGPTGSGKTMATMAYAASKGLVFYSTPSSNGLEPSSLFGRYIPDGLGSYVWQDGPVTYVFRNGGVLLVNEINFIPPRVSTALFGAFDDRRAITLLDHGGEVVRAHRPECWCKLPAEECRTKWVLVVADYNRGAGYSGTVELNWALRNRFGVQLQWEYDTAVEKKLVPYECLRKLAKHLRDSRDIQTPVAPNMLMAFALQAQDLGWEFAVAVFVSKFAPDERKTIATTIDAMRIEMQRELIRQEQPIHIGEDGTVWDGRNYDLSVKGTPDNPNPHNHPGWTPDHGIYGVDWGLRPTTGEKK